MPRFAPDKGGVETHVARLIDQLQSRGYRITVVTTQADEQVPLVQETEWGKIVRLPHRYRLKKLATWWWLWRNRSLLYQASLIHVHDVFWWLYPVFPLLKLWGKPILTTFHGYERAEGPTRGAVWQRQLIEKLSDDTICIGGFMQEWYGATCEHVSYGAASLTEQSMARPQPHSAVFLGRLAADTGITIYLRALQLMDKPIKLSVFGEGPELATARAIVEKHQLPVTFQGWTNQVAQQLTQHRYAFVSQYLAIVEAMQSQQLVVAVYQDAMKHDYLLSHPMVNNMVIAGSAEELVEKLAKLNKAEEIAMVRRAHAWARHQTWSAVADLYERVWSLVSS